ncbi:MAG: caspase family protein [Saprospiraceae bacterium]|nr:caspase family protein [Saprospiraceae bacterium]MCF8251546.1 caspase family protein [Saprospiraceae bacterium]MCF8280876.1 caspase family protein [Bacteroidales bacterium]MCF8310944.1 caspase family protein [Saprospiraceae bacterium]MCF8439720.1 caspase family protein [Saprospiraceae bacterium]
MKNLLTFLVLLAGICHPVRTLTQTIHLNGHTTRAVVIGISDYQDEGIPDLRFADRDAEAFAGFLRSPAGGALDEDHLKVLINKQATVAQFAIALDWLMEVAKENDRVLVYFSGHGDVERKSLTQPIYLLCWDAPALVYLAGGAIGTSDVL